MKEIEKVHAVLKKSPEDFVVEEIGEKWPCKVSNLFPSNKNPEVNLKEEEKRDFIWCELEKRDIDHFHAIKEIANQLKKSIRAIGYAGSKDRLAHTSQRISIFQPNIEDIKKFNHEKIYLKNIKWGKRKIKIGYLDANHFKITLRDIDKKDAVKISNSIRTTPFFPNYFGSQRFGSVRENNVKIGLLLIKRKFKEAVEEILYGDSPKERDDVKEVRKKLLQEKNYHDAISYFPKVLQLERSILINLAKDPENYINAINRSEQKNILMCANSVQSKIFNDILKQALEEGVDFSKEGQRSVPLLGYKMKFSNGRLGEIEEEVLAKYKLNLQDFDINEIPFLRIKGSYRKAIIEVKDINVEIGDDEQNEGTKKIILEFTLPSGAYATTYLGEFFELT